MKELNIQIPEGYEIDKEKSTFEKIILKKKETSYPKTWEKFCKNNPNAKDEYFIDTFSDIIEVDNIYRNRNIEDDKNYIKTREEAEAFLALIQLKRLWHEYIDNSDKNLEHIWDIDYLSNYGFLISRYNFIKSNSIFFFSDFKQATEFLNNFKDLFEKIKPLYELIIL